MPQLSLLTDRIPIGFDFSYKCDPLHPERDAHFHTSAKQTDGTHLELCSAAMPANVIWEAGSMIMLDTWNAYLFGEPGDMQAAFTRAKRIWRHESLNRRWH